MLRAVLAMTFGNTSDEIKEVQDITALEGMASLVLILAIVLLGVAPSIVNDSIMASVDFILQGLGGI
jgi:NADH:ubiquinone oxidoreductase subunit 4 (subunit M)